MQEGLFTEGNIQKFKAMEAYEKARIAAYCPPTTAIDKLISSLILNWRTLYETDRLMKRYTAKMMQRELGDTPDDRLVWDLIDKIGRTAFHKRPFTDGQRNAPPEKE